MSANFDKQMHRLLFCLPVILICAISLLTYTTQSANADTLAAGLRGEYFDNEDFTNLKLTRTDATVDFSLGFGTPDPLINSETFSVRWVGQVTAPVTGNYVFVTQSDDGVRFWLGDQLLIDNFTPHPLTENRSAVVALVAGQSYDLRLEYFELTANAIIRLMWIRPGQSSPEVIPSANLATPVNPNLAPVLSALSPSAAPVNGSQFTLTVSGTNFLPGAFVQLNNSPRTTVFTSSTQLTAMIPATDLTTIRNVKITAVNPLPGGGTSNPLSLTIAGGFEGDVAPRPNGSTPPQITIADWTQLGRFSSALDTVTAGNELQRADCAPRASLGDGRISLADWVQAGRYASVLDQATAAGGPSNFANLLVEPADDSINDRQINPPADLLEQSLLGLTDSRWLNHPTQPPASRAVFAVAQSPYSVAVVCEGQGGENAFGFSFSFDTTRWQFVSAATGVDAGEATLFVNSRQVSTGRVGLAMALSPNRGQMPGARQIVVLTFHPRFGNISPSSQQAVIEFADHPVRREVIDVNARNLRSTFVSKMQSSGSREIARQGTAKR